MSEKNSNPQSDRVYESNYSGAIMTVGPNPDQHLDPTGERVLLLEPAEDGFDLRELGRKLWRRKGIILATSTILTTLAALVIFQLTPRYTAETQIVVDTRQSKVVDVEAVLSGLSVDNDMIQTEVEIIRSRSLARKTIAQLGLDSDPEFNEVLPQPSGIAQLLDPRRHIPEEWLAVLFGPPDDENSTQEDQAETTQTRVTEAFLAALTVVPQRRSRVIKLAFSSANPHKAAKIANTLADFYIVSQLEVKFEATQTASKWLSERLEELREQVAVSESAVEEFRNESGLLRGRDATLAAQDVSELSMQIAVERTELAEGEARLHQMESLLNSPGGIESVSEVLQSPLIQRLREQEAQLEGKVAELFVTYAERHPKMINARAEVGDIREKIKVEIEKIAQGLRNEIAVARVREAGLNRRLTELKSEVALLNRTGVQLRALEREADANRMLFETFLVRLKETTAQESFQQSDSAILSRADVPENPSFPNKRRLLSLSLLGAVSLGILLAFAIEKLDRGFRSMEQVAQLRGVAPLGLIPALKGLRRLGKTPSAYILEKPGSAYAEAIRSLGTSIFLADVGGRPKVILITSALVKEGKTSVTTSLARLQASVGKKVVVVDCDLRRPAAHKEFGFRSSPGLVEVLAGEASLDEVMQRDPISGAHVLVAGGRAPSPAELLGSERMKKLLKTLSRSYDLVIIDSAPVMAVSDTRVLARLADKTIFLVRWADTPREVATAALQQIIDAGADVIGVQLSMVDVKKHAGYGYSDSGSYYGPMRKYYTS
jgi:succinoglycan biosynthesis transport protein ExoP